MTTATPRRCEVGQTCPATANRPAFTLVEILIVIAIIGILMGIAIPAITNAVTRARVAKIRLEISSLEQAVEQYKDEYGDYPPDFSSWNVIQQHYRKAFPRMSPNDMGLLTNLLHDSSGDFQAAELDRGKAIVWTLGGYSKDQQRPFTGPGGPLAWVGDGSNSYSDAAVTDTDRQTPANYQINLDRPNSKMDFDLARLDYTQVDPAQPMTGANRRLSSDGKLFASYHSDTGGAPYVYFDSRTYGLYDPNVNSGAGDFNGYGSTTFGYVRPYLSDVPQQNTSGGNYPDIPTALAAWQWVNPNKFQIISAGLDNNFGATSSYGGGPVYFQFPTGNAIAPQTGVDNPQDLVVSGVSKYQESTFGDNNQYPADNITNFSNGRVVDETP